MPPDFLPLKCDTGTVLFRPEQECPGYVEVEEGVIRVSITAPNGREVVLYRVRPGDVCLQTFACLLDGRTYSAEGVCESPVAGRILPPAEFQRRIAGDAGFRQNVFAAIAHRFADYEKLVEEIALTGFDARLARVLMRLADDRGEVHATHESLAAETASGRAFVSRRLADFARLGVVELGRGWLRIADRDGLERIAADEK
jgi:CRP/FNR family transcriptional regulator